MPMTAPVSDPLDHYTAPAGEYLAMLRSPKSGQALHLDGRSLVSADEKERFDISPSGVPLLAAEFLSDAARVQKHHYDGMVAGYVENLDYPHTQEYMAYLDQQLFAVLPRGTLGTV